MSPEPPLIGIVEDDAIMGESLVQSLTLEGYAVHWWQDGASAMGEIETLRPDLVVCDIRLPDADGQTVFKTACNAGGKAPFLFITAYGDIDQAVGLMRAGAGDYLTKPFAMEDFLNRTRQLLDSGQRDQAEGVLGISRPMLELEALLRRLAQRPSSVLIAGETGAGKEVCARFLHTNNPRKDAPFMAVNCAAIPDNLLESEIFGHERGAFTGASGRHLGYAERARGGVLFLDQIGELPLPLQAKLLRILEERRFTRLGGEQSLTFEARLICATNADLYQAVRDGRFREDLYYRINVVSIEVPPLRDRPEDISWLMQRFFAEFTASMGVELRGIGSLAEEVALAHDWPGNVRELRNRVERGVALALGDMLMPADLFPEYRGASDETAAIASLAEVREAAERRQIERALAETQGQMQAAARLLGVSRTTLWEKLRRYGLTAGLTD
ncbi:sigma-54-dependent transcriptional regulator [Oceanibaculum indicum]|uniref:DNA-binding NtrC family response regulator n=1 Tax=Oceanibaculum indicum TaxID=526216 RepID=A0A420WQT7_9PROT|nr:sigma-54 dependent transcriptional regulator [Oceanibaculum indicum]RKQ73359.1 DNA-binding NtrC family response regulator [Oceanibaculum indicum]